MKRSRKTEATDKPVAPAFEIAADGADDGQKPNGDDSCHCECGGNKVFTVDSVGDVDIMHSESEEDEDGSHMEDEYDAIDVERVQRANFIDDDWELKKWILRFQRHEIGKTDFIDAAVLKTLDDWNLMDKVYTLTSRNVDTIDETIKSIKSQLEEKNRLPLDSRLFSVSCCAEMLGLIAKDAFEEISRIIIKLEWRHQAITGPMWHETNTNLKNALGMESVEGLNSEADRVAGPSADELGKAWVVYRLVESAYAVAKQLFEVKHPTANKFLYNLQELRANLGLEASSSDCFTCSVAKKMLKRLDKYIREAFLVLAIASVMDPRCKMQYIDYISTRIHAQFVQANDLPRKSDLDIYLEEPVLPWDENFNVLKWWKSEGPKYPNVSKMARGVLAIPISVATSQDAYYNLEKRPDGVDVITSGAQLMNAVMCCRSWMPGKSIPTSDLKMWFLAAGVHIC